MSANSKFRNHTVSYSYVRVLQIVMCLFLNAPIYHTSAASTHRFNPAADLPSFLILSLLRGAEQMGMHKAVKPHFGGGMRRFSCDEDNIYENIESELCFFTSQVRSQNCLPTQFVSKLKIYVLNIQYM